MATIIPTSDLIGAPEQINTITTPAIVNAGALYIPEGVNVLSTGADAISNDSATSIYSITVLGNVYGHGGAIDFQNASGYVDLHVMVGSTGTLMAEAGTTLYAYSGTGDGNLSVVNAGSISAQSSAVIWSDDIEATLIRNSGEMSNAISSQWASTLYTNVLRLEGRAATVYNSGTIMRSADGAGLALSPSQQERNAAILFDGQVGAELTNSGLISGENAIYAASYNTWISNSGIIEGTIYIEGTHSAGSLILFNTGAMGTEVVSEPALTVLQGRSVIVNRGEINGSVNLSGEADRVDSFGGRIEGTLYTFDGDDTIYTDQSDLVIRAGGGTDLVVARSDVLDVTGAEEIRLLGAGDYSVTGDDTLSEEIRGNIGNNLLDGQGGHDTILGGAGDDQIIGGDGWDSLLGGTGNDLMSGDAGSDLIMGGAGNDTLTGGADMDGLWGDSGHDDIDGGWGNDTILAGSGDDTVLGGGDNDYMLGQSGEDEMDGGEGADRLGGGDGNDTLRGGTGNDTITGDAGDDVLYGGEGYDILIGKSGNDSFVFETIAEIDDGTNSDRIKDFQQGDLIDVSGIDEEAGFTFLGTGGFTASGEMEIRYVVSGTGATLVMFDVDGDGLSDGELLLLGCPDGVTADDFVL